jgi:aquaporin Z
MNQRALAAEFIGTFMLVFGGVGTVLYSAPFGGGMVAVSLAFGLSVLCMAYALGPISGGHFNPAVTVGLVAGGRFPGADAIGYIIAQVLGGIAAAFVLSMILSGTPIGAGVTKWNSLAAASNPNTFGAGLQFSTMSILLIECVMAALFLIIIMGATSKRAPVGFAPIAIGLAVCLFHLISIPVSNTSLNPARSTATAIFGGSAAISALWMFWVAPLAGAIVGAFIAKWIHNE